MNLWLRPCAYKKARECLNKDLDSTHHCPGCLIEGSTDSNVGGHPDCYQRHVRTNVIHLKLNGEVNFLCPGCVSNSVKQSSNREPASSHEIPDSVNTTLTGTMTDVNVTSVLSCTTSEMSASAGSTNSK